MFSISFGDPQNPRHHLSRWEMVMGGGVADLAKTCTTWTYSASIFVPNYRLDRNFRCANLLVLDFDEGVPLGDVAAKVQGLTFCLAPTRNHGVDKNDGKGVQDRFRLILELEKTVWDLEVYKHTAKRWAEALGADMMATSGAQAWRISREIALLEAGDKARIHTDVPFVEKQERQKRDEERRERLATNRVLTKSMMRVLDNEIPEGAGNQTIYRAACDAFDCGWDYGRVISEFSIALPWFREAGGEDTVRSAAKKKLVPA